MPWSRLPGGDRSPPDPKPVGESLDRVVSALGGPTAGALTAIFARWPEVVGDRVAAHARPLSIDDGRLVVGVEEPGWATQLRYLEADLLRRLADVAGEGVVRRIDVRVRPG